jgi:hypothetical protein
MNCCYVTFWLIGYGLGILTGVFGTMKLVRRWVYKARLKDIFCEYLGAPTSR